MLLKAIMMAADDFQLIRKTLDELEYYDELDSTSLPLVKHILKDLQTLSKHCSDVEQENERFKSEKGSSLTIAMPNGDVLNETYLMEMVDSANDQVENLRQEVLQLRAENQTLKMGMDGFSLRKVRPFQD